MKIPDEIFGEKVDGALERFLEESKGKDSGEVREPGHLRNKSKNISAIRILAAQDRLAVKIRNGKVIFNGFLPAANCSLE